MQTAPDRIQTSIPEAGTEARTVRDALHQAETLLVGCDTPALDAQLLVAHALGWSRASVLAHGDRELSGAEVRAIAHLVARRAEGVPVAYLRGAVSWWDSDLRVTSDVLIPRPDTEVLVERAIAIVHEAGVRVAVDVGTGSGAIAVALARGCPALHIVATDISTLALGVAADNVREHALEDRIILRAGDLLTAVDQEPGLLVANLPYLSDDMMASLPRDVRHEPKLALHGGPDGLDLYRSMVADVARRGWTCPILFEIDPRQSDDALSLVRASLPDARLTVLRDLEGRNRVVEVQRP